MVLDESKLGVQADILVDVARGIVRLRAKDRANFKDTLKDAHHGLFIKLRALRQERWPPKVVQLEDVSAAFSSRRHDLRCLYLGKSACAERTAKPRHCPRGQPQHGTARQVAVSHNGMIKQRTKAR